MVPYRCYPQCDDEDNSKEGIWKQAFYYHCRNVEIYRCICWSELLLHHVPQRHTTIADHRGDDDIERCAESIIA